MSRAVIHRTPGLLDATSFMVFGASAKPNSTNPIGFFGTGLKIAIAVLLRHGIKVKLFVGHTEYVFYTQTESFRGKDLNLVRMKKRKGFLSAWNYSKLPFTTELGKTWELWQAFRELHANTLDEGGETSASSASFIEDGLPDETVFVIQDSRYYDCYADRDKIFLPDGATERSESTGEIQVLDRPSKHIYYRGMRIMDLREEAQFTYNFLKDVTLTEDRTAKFPSLLESDIASLVMKSEDNVFVQRAVHAPRQTFERGLSYSYASSYTAPSRTFMAAAETSPNPTIKDAWDNKQPTVPTDSRFMITIHALDITADDVLSVLGQRWPDIVSVTHINGQSEDMDTPQF